MATLSTTDMKLIDSIFGIYSGWVLDFSNSTFDAFFRRDVGVNIYDDAYATYGNSKGKRFRAPGERSTRRSGESTYGAVGIP